MPDFSILTSQLSEIINATTVLTIIGNVISATVLIFLAVWGGRKIICELQNAIMTDSFFSDLGGYKTYKQYRSGFDSYKEYRRWLRYSRNVWRYDDKN